MNTHYNLKNIIFIILGIIIGTVLFTAVGIAIIVIAKRIKKDEVKE